MTATKKMNLRAAPMSNSGAYTTTQSRYTQATHKSFRGGVRHTNGWQGPQVTASRMANSARPGWAFFKYCGRRSRSR